MGVMLRALNRGKPGTPGPIGRGSCRSARTDGEISYLLTSDMVHGIKHGREPPASGRGGYSCDVSFSWETNSSSCELVAKVPRKE
jgi:hypothetical protein